MVLVRSREEIWSVDMTGKSAPINAAGTNVKENAMVYAALNHPVAASP
jgi:hypothetical protein